MIAQDGDAKREKMVRESKWEKGVRGCKGVYYSARDQTRELVLRTINSLQQAGNSGGSGKEKVEVFWQKVTKIKNE